MILASKKWPSVVALLAVFTSTFVVNPTAKAWNDSASIAVSTFGGGFRDEPRSIKIDGDGNIYSTGYFRGTVDFDPGEGVVSLTSSLASIYLLKLDSFGNFLWVKSFGGSIGGNSGNTIALDGVGHLYLGGNFAGKTDFDPGVNTAFITPATGEDAFIVKLDLNGNYVWARSFGGVGVNAGADGIGTLAVDGRGDIIASGLFRGELDFDPGTGETKLLSTFLDKSSFFILKLDSSGDFKWAKSIATSGPPYGGTLSLDNSGDVYAAGIFNGSADFDPGKGVETRTAKGQDTFIVKLNSLGDYKWANTYGAGIDAPRADDDWIFSLANDGVGNVYATGFFGGTVDFDLGPGDAKLSASGTSSDIFILKLSPSGGHIWSKKYGNSGNDTGWSIATDGGENVFVAGVFTGEVNFNPGESSGTLTSLSNSDDTFILKLGSSGNFLWAKRIGGEGEDKGIAISLDRTGNIHTAGIFTGTVNFNPNMETPSFTSIGLADIFISKLDSSGNAPLVAKVSSGTVANSKVVTIPSGVKEAAMAATSVLPAIKLNFGGTVPTTVTVKPTTNPAPSSATPFMTSGSPKIVDIELSSTHDGTPVTICLDGASSDRVYHYTNGAWVELGSRSYSNGQVCGVTTSFSPFTAAPPVTVLLVASDAAAKAAAELAAAKREAEKQAARADITSKLESAKDLSVDSFAKAEIAGITSSNIAAVQAELLALPEITRADINQVLKVARKYEVVGNIGSDQINYMQSNSFVEIGLIPATSKNKVALVAAVKKLPATARDSYAEIKVAIESETKKIQARQDRLALVMARNATRSGK